MECEITRIKKLGYKHYEVVCVMRDNMNEKPKFMDEMENLTMGKAEITQVG